jgi:hypothetical protein
MLFRETVAVYSENHTELTVHSVGKMKSSNMLKNVEDTVTTGF